MRTTGPTHGPAGAATTLFGSDEMKRLAAAILLVGMWGQALAFDPFVVKDIRVEGIQRTDPGSVFGALPFRIGDTYNDEKGATALRAS